LNVINPVSNRVPAQSSLFPTLFNPAASAAPASAPLDSFETASDAQPQTAATTAPQDEFGSALQHMIVSLLTGLLSSLLKKIGMGDLLPKAKKADATATKAASKKARAAHDSKSKPTKAHASSKPEAASNGKGASGKVKQVLDEARKHLGFHEGANNSNPFSKLFGRSNEPWCADFVSYCMTKSSVKYNQSYTPTMLAQFKQRGQYHRNNPKPGDIVMFGHGGAQHTGLVEKVFKKNGQWYIGTIEGNASDSVKRNTYPVSSSYVLGFGTIIK
jgi:uncharacterized protein (TIGR02594 family)